MKYTLWSGTTELGETELELPRGQRGERSGIFHPLAAFERVAPLFQRRQELVGRLATLAADRPAGGAPAEAMRRALAESGLGEVLRGSRRELEALTLELRQADGTALSARRLDIFQVEWPPPADATAAAASARAAAMAAAGFDPDAPGYILTVLPSALEPGDVAEPEPRRAAG